MNAGRRVGASAGLAAGIAGFALILALPAPAGLPDAAWSTLAVAFLMAAWWISEALPVAVTAMLPLILFPLLGVMPVTDTAAPYADPVIFLFLGGLTLGRAIEHWGLHRRIALAIIARFGLRPSRLVLGFMLAAAFLSMWVSNTATAAMMLPVCASTVLLFAGPPSAAESTPGAGSRFATALMTGVAFAASIGGMATLIGTPPNALFAAFMHRTRGIEIGFGQWMLLGVPISAVFLIGTWAIVTRLVYPVPTEGLSEAADRLGPAFAAPVALTAPQIRIAAIFVATALAWITRPYLAEIVPGLTDTGIALAAAIALFLTPSGRGGRLMDWSAMAGLPWGVLLLFGGGLSLSTAIGASGLADWLGAELAALAAFDIVVLTAGAILVTVALSELASNTATAATLLPVVASIGAGLGLGPHALTVPVALAASCGLMLPVATPPNALFYSSGYITTGQLARAGALADLLGSLVVLAATLTLATIVFGG